MNEYLCKDLVENIMDYIDLELDSKTLEELQIHLGVCPECKSFVNTYKKMLELSGSLKNKKFVTPEVRKRLKEFLLSKIKSN